MDLNHEFATGAYDALRSCDASRLSTTEQAACAERVGSALLAMEPQGGYDEGWAWFLRARPDIVQRTFIEITSAEEALALAATMPRRYCWSCGRGWKGWTGVGTIWGDDATEAVVANGFSVLAPARLEHAARIRAILAVGGRVWLSAVDRRHVDPTWGECWAPTALSKSGGTPYGAPREPALWGEPEYEWIRGGGRGFTGDWSPVEEAVGEALRRITSEAVRTAVAGYEAWAAQWRYRQGETAQEAGSRWLRERGPHWDAVLAALELGHS